MGIASLRVITVGTIVLCCGALIAPTAAAASPAPTVTGVSPAVGRTTGGNYVTVAGTNLGSVTRASFGSATSTKVKHISSTLIQVAAPSHGTGRVDLRVTGPGGTSKATSSDYYYFVVHSPHLTWTKPARVAGVSGDGLSSLSCAAANHCVAIDDHQREFTWNGHVFSHRSFDPNSTNVYDFVSCGSPSFCMTVGTNQSDPGDVSPTETNAVAFLGSTVTRRVSVGQPYQLAMGLSCPSARMCVLLQDGGYATTYRDGHWGKPVHFSSDFYVENYSFDCPTETFCIGIGLSATKNAKPEATFDGHSWHVRSLEPPATLGVDPTTMSCALPSYCVGGPYNGGAPVIRRGSTWGVGSTNGARVGDLSEISCATVAFCVETTGSSEDSSRNATIAFDGAAASSTPNPIHGGLISCPTDQLCMVAGTDTIALARRVA